LKTQKGEGHGITETGTGVIPLQAKESQGWDGEPAVETRKKQWRILPKASEKVWPR
jgi:hypothetical protein